MTKPANILAVSTISNKAWRRTPPVCAFVTTDRGVRMAYGHTPREAINRASFKAR